MHNFSLHLDGQPHLTEAAGAWSPAGEPCGFSYTLARPPSASSWEGTGRVVSSARPPQAPEPEMLQDTTDVTFPPGLTRRLPAEMQLMEIVCKAAPRPFV